MLNVSATALRKNVSATALRKHLFDYLGKAARGEAVIVRWKGVDAVRLISAANGNWRDRLGEKPRLKTTPGKAFAPLAEIWKKYR